MFVYFSFITVKHLTFMVTLISERFIWIKFIIELYRIYFKVNFTSKSHYTYCIVLYKRVIYIYAIFRRSHNILPWMIFILKGSRGTLNNTTATTTITKTWLIHSIRLMFKCLKRCLFRAQAHTYILCVPKNFLLTTMNLYLCK